MILGATHLALLGLLLGAGTGDAPLTRAQLVGDVQMPDWHEHVRLCANGGYVHYLAVGGIVRGEWQVEPSGLILTAREVCLDQATSEKGQRFLGCFAPEAGIARAEEQNLHEVRIVPEIAVSELRAMLAGKPPPDAGPGVKPWTHQRTPEPKICDPGFRPRGPEDLVEAPPAPKAK